MKKILVTSALSIALIVPMAGQAFAADTFKDIENSTAKAQIQALQDKGIVNGLSASEFGPSAKLTAAQGISLIVKSMQLSLAAIDFNQAPTAEGYFSTVSNDAWYADNFVVARANQLDLPGDIDPKAPMTKEAFVHYLVQGLEKTGEYPLIKMYIAINDEKDITVDLQGTIQRALLYKLTALDDKGDFNPQSIITREEAAVMIYNAAEFVETHKDIDNGQGTEEEGGVDGSEGGTNGNSSDVTEGTIGTENQ